jgi:CheY-like chemotaxis protein
MPDLIRDHVWASDEHPRVLIEATEWGTRAQIASILRDEGYETVACPGPEGSGQRCSLAAGHGCGAAEEVDVVVHALRSWDPRNLEALRALRQRLPTTPVVVEVPPAERARREIELAGCVVLDAPFTPASLVAAVAHATAGPAPGT